MSISDKSYTTLRLILGDQLNIEHSWFSKVDDAIVYVLMEVRSETDYVQHHIQKVAAIFQAMELFAKRLSSLGHQVLYISLNDVKNRQSIPENCKALIQNLSIKEIQYQVPDEYRLDQQLLALSSLGIPCVKFNTEHFYTKRLDLQHFFKDKKQFLMESFYRSMRTQHNVLMDREGKPVGGQWNFDKENRQPLKATSFIPDPKRFPRKVSSIIKKIHDHGVRTIGVCMDDTIDWPLTLEEARECLTYFIDFLLPKFGLYQDAMVLNEPFLFHSRLSFALNIKLISPVEVVKSVEVAYHKNPNKYPIAAIEGYIRQILGWREYMRGMYWALMPTYATENYFQHSRKLPEYFWTGNTKMQCIKSAVNQSLQHAYAHHIQRLMITGNFALLAGIHPDAVDAWYLGIYIDAFEWVEITNTRGMSQFADGGKVGSKPYVSSAAYIHKMSNYCGSCYYNNDVKIGDKACPFNSLYWNFYYQHKDKLSKNPRIGMMYATWNKMKEEDRQALLTQASIYLENIEEL
ncbi:MAG: cryptochrome/photolyase family protein [Cytophagaceae bacterium]|nr:cryptochrome/photolyase family protein [Cytophagaceae bacterium]